jgi:hypothetical protein
MGRIDLLEINPAIIGLSPIEAIDVLRILCREAGVCLVGESDEVKIKAAEWSGWSGLVVTDANGDQFQLRISSKKI